MDAKSRKNPGEEASGLRPVHHTNYFHQVETVQAMRVFL